MIVEILTLLRIPGLTQSYQKPWVCMSLERGALEDTSLDKSGFFIRQEILSQGAAGAGWVSYRSRSQHICDSSHSRHASSLVNTRCLVSMADVMLACVCVFGCVYVCSCTSVCYACRGQRAMSGQLFSTLCAETMSLTKLAGNQFG